MKTIFFSIFSLFAIALINAQDIHLCKEVNVKIYSEAPLENIEAVTSQAVSAINTNENTLYFEVPIQSLDFEKDLMEEHFNENYMESDKYPTAKYNGTFASDISWDAPGTYEVEVKGTMEVHGEKQERVDKGTVTIAEDGTISSNAVFKVKCVDHKIKIPKLVIKNIAEEIEVTLSATYAPYEK